MERCIFVKGLNGKSPKIFNPNVGKSLKILYAFRPRINENLIQNLIYAHYFTSKIFVSININKIAFKKKFILQKTYQVYNFIETTRMTNNPKIFIHVYCILCEINFRR